MSRPFCNTLCEGDRVFDVELERYGNVEGQPRGSSLTVAVVFEGANSSRRRPLLALRFDPDRNGKHEEVPPHDGDYPTAQQPAPTKTDGTAVGLLKEERAKAAERLETHRKAFTTAKAEIEKLDEAIKVLERPIPAAP